MRTIKRYSNRKLYDTENKKYITLEGVADLIKAGHDIEVIENDTGEDLTAVTLSQIIFEQEKRGSSTPRGFFTNLIRFGSTSPIDMLRRAPIYPATMLSAIEKEIERRLDELVEQGEMAEEQVRRLRHDLMERFRDGKLRENDESLLSRLNIPTHSDLSELARRLDGVSERLDELISATREGRGELEDELREPVVEVERPDE